MNILQNIFNTLTRFEGIWKGALFLVALLVLCPLLAKAQGSNLLTNMWKEYDEAQRKDLPQTCLKILDKISKKSESEKDYASLLKAELKKVDIYEMLAPDSMEMVGKNLLKKTEQVKGKDKVAYAIFNLAIYQGYRDLSLSGEKDRNDYLEEAFADMDILANTKAKDWSLIIDDKKGSAIFNDDMLSIMGYTALEYDRLYDYYKKAGNRRACARLALEGKINGGTSNLPKYIEEYKDLPEGAYLADKYYKACKNSRLLSDAERYELLQTYRKQWAGTKEAVIFENHQRDIQEASLRLSYMPTLVRINEEKECEIEAKNVSKVKFTAIPLNVAARNLSEEMSDANHFHDKILSEYATKEGKGYKGQKEVFMDFNIENYYTTIKNKIKIPALEGGIYLVKLESLDEKDKDSYKDPDGFTVDKNATYATDYAFLYVSNLKILRLSLPNRKERQVVVDSKTGHEIKDAKVVTNGRRGMAAYTDTDNGMPFSQVYLNNYYESAPDHQAFRLNTYLDRGIYRPGQTLHIASILHKITDGVNTSVMPKEKVTFTLKDANYQEIAKKETITDDFGTVSAEFVLPTDRLTGTWHIEARSNQCYDSENFRVEEYKRPTFEVSFNKYEKEYKLGDTITVVGIAKTYAGVPVANGKVAYTVMRERPWWSWWRCYGEGEQLKKDTVTTNDKGEFLVTVPLSLPNGITAEEANAQKDIICYHYKINAAATSTSGETREGESFITASNKALLFNISIKEKFINTDNSGLSVSVRNNAGKELTEAKVTFKVDNQPKPYASIDDANAAIKKLDSGLHIITAQATYKDNVENDTARFTIFSLEDKTPVEKTKHWTYITHKQFKSIDDVITLQFGTSDEDAEIFYDVIVGNEHKESTVLHASNSLIRKDIKAVKGKNILVVYAWVKNNELYSQQYCLRQAEPEKSLNLKWKTFRNKLLPGQKEEWTLNIENPRTKSGSNIQLLANLYDKSLDAIASSYWSTMLGMTPGYSNTDWRASYISVQTLLLRRRLKTDIYETPNLSSFNIWPLSYSDRYMQKGMLMYSTAGGGARPRALAKGMAIREDMEEMAMLDAMPAEAPMPSVEDNASRSNGTAKPAEEKSKADGVEMRSNFAETAFFYPQLMADENGDVNIKFTLPESTTIWIFRALAHDKDMNNGMLHDEIIAQKQLMISPNMPRFIRKGDKAVLASVISNLSEKTLNTKTTIEILDPDTEKVLYTESTANTLEAGKTAPVNFNLNPEAFAATVPDASPSGSTSAADILPLYIVKIFTVADGYSDGEQRYLAIIDNVEPVMTTKSITMIKPGKETVTTADLFPADATNKKLTVEWTENPAWLMLETLPYMNSQDQTTIYSKAAAYYANALGANILNAMPEKTKQTILGQNDFESTSSATVPAVNGASSASPLEKNPELKTLLLNETPWAMDAKNETERIQMLKNFYDENKLTYNQEQLLKKLKDEQKSDGGWSWCPGMETSYWMTSEICELFVRLNNMIGKQQATSSMLKKALNCLQKKAHEEIVEWKKEEKKGGTPYIYDCYALQFVYLKALSGDNLTKQEKSDADFVIKYLKKQERNNSLFMKAKLAIVLHYMGETKIAKEYIQSINEYSVLKELEGRYFDTRRAGYSWRDYKQPTQTMVIEALKAITPSDVQTIAEYQRWLLMQKRTQMWDTPINTVNNVYAFVSPSAQSSGSKPSAISHQPSASLTERINAFGADGKGYSKNTYIGANIPTVVELEKQEPSANSQQPSASLSERTPSWGAVYAQYKQKATNISDFSEGLKITREIISAETSLPLREGQGGSVGSKVKVRITIVADRDYDFVQIVDKRAACLEPAVQTSGYRWASSLTHREGWGGSGGYYEAPQDSRTCYYYDMLHKGTHTLETEYYIDRAGDYQSGTCTVQCAYSPEFYGRTGAITIQVKTP